jgi:hypothetical protein
MEVHGGLDDMFPTHKVDLWVTKYRDGRPMKRNSHAQGTCCREDYLRSGRPRTLIWVIALFRSGPPTRYVMSSVRQGRSTTTIEPSLAQYGLCEHAGLYCLVAPVSLASSRSTLSHPKLWRWNEADQHQPQRIEMSCAYVEFSSFQHNFGTCYWC